MQLLRVPMPGFVPSAWREINRVYLQSGLAQLRSAKEPKDSFRGSKPDPFRPPPRMLSPHLRHGHLNRRRSLKRR